MRMFSVGQAIKRAGVTFVAITMILGLLTVPDMDQYVYGAGGVNVEQSAGTVMARQGDDEVSVELAVTNQTGGTLSVYGEMVLPDVSTEITASSTKRSDVIQLEAGQTGTLYFKVDIGKSADVGLAYIPIEIYNNAGNVLLETYDRAAVRISQKLASGNDGNYLASMDLDYSLSNPEGIIAGANNEISIKLFNRGNTLIKNMEVSLILPEGISIDNAVATQFVGYMFSGDKQTIKFPVTASTKLESKNYTMEVDITGKDQGNNSVSFKKTLYIPVIAGGAYSMRDLNITNISIPQQALAGEDFTLSFQVKNNGAMAAEDLKITVEPTEGLINKTKNIFIESSIAKGDSKNYSVTFFSKNSAEQQSYPIKITVEPVAGADTGSDTVLQYASIMLKQVSGSSKTPQLMVDSYSYGGTYVQAGSQFRLSLGLYNTSGGHDLTNIKVTIGSDDGTFIPVNSSNSFFIDEIDKKGRVTKTLYLSVRQGAEQKTTALNVDMSYEDGAGNAFNAKDVISIPVMQETRLQVDEIIAPPELYAFMQSGVSVQFYNMGKTTLNNLRITAEGDFDTPESTSYFGGNMESGKSDYYDFTFIPRQGGTMEGRIIFTYEDASGNEQRFEKPFAFEVMAEMPVFDEGIPPDMDMGNQTNKLPWIIGGIVLVLAIAGFIIWRKLRKRKMNREMEINE